MSPDIGTTPTAGWRMILAVAIATLGVTFAFDALMLWTLATNDFLAMLDGGVRDRALLVATWIAMLAIAAVTLSYAIAGFLLTVRQPSRRIGAVLLGGGLLFATVPLGYIVGGWLVLLDPLDPLANLVFLLGPASVAGGYALILPILALLFPDGRLPSPRWRGPAMLAVGLIVVATLVAILRPGPIAGARSLNPLGIDEMPPWLSVAGDYIAGLGVALASILGVGAVVARYRRGRDLERHQLRWFVAAVLLAAFPLAVAPQPGIGGPVWLALSAVGLLLIPAAVWVAVTRYRLYEIDRIISRTIGWALVTATILITFGGLVIGLQAALTGITGRDSETVIVAASTLAALALVQPVRRRIQHAIDRRFDRARYDGEQTAAAFAERLRFDTDLDSLVADLTATVGGAVRPSGTALWLADTEHLPAAQP